MGVSEEGGHTGKSYVAKGRKERKTVSGGVCGGLGGWWLWRGETKELLWMEVYDVNPFLSPLHTNNKKPA